MIEDMTLPWSRNAKEDRESRSSKRLSTTPHSDLVKAFKQTISIDVHGAAKWTDTSVGLMKGKWLKERKNSFYSRGVYNAILFHLFFSGRHELERWASRFHSGNFYQEQRYEFVVLAKPLHNESAMLAFPMHVNNWKINETKWHWMDIYSICILLNLQMCEIILPRPVHHR